jgi:hypothetical protein
MVFILKKSCCIRILGIFLVTVFLISGCNAPRNALNKFDASFQSEALGSSNFSRAIKLAQSNISKGTNPKKEDLLWSLQLGSIERLNRDYSQSNEYFDQSEKMLNYFDYQNKTVDSAAAIATNENIVPYVGEEYDGIMVNTYKALNFMALGDRELARIEFNRALERQRRAMENFAAEIAKLKKEIDKEDAKENSTVKDNVDNPEIQKLIQERYPTLFDFKAYPDFVNPFTTYIAGIFFDLDGDYSKATTLLKESYGMVSDNDYVGQDFALTEQVLDGNKEFKNMVWVIFENGMGPVKEEFRIDIPLFIEKRRDRGSDFKYFGIALPRLVFREEAFPYLTIEAEGQSYRTQQVANMDRVIQTEFEKDFKGILTRAIISTTSKAVAQYALSKKGNGKTQVASLLVAAYSFATTAADVRIWTTLPKDFQVARLDIPEDRQITISPPGGQSFQVEIPPCNNSLIYVKIPFRQAKPVYNIITY